MNREKNLKDDLEKIYADVSEWLKFAETKHAVMLTFWTAIIVAILSVDVFQELNRCLYYILLSVLLLGSVINIASFIPFLNQSKAVTKVCYRFLKKKYKKVSTVDNFLFYQNIFYIAGAADDELKIRVNVYERKLHEYYGTWSEDKLISAYLEQIVSVSTVATIKVFLFEISIKYMAILFCLAFIAIMVA